MRSRIVAWRVVTAVLELLVFAPAVQAQSAFISEVLFNPPGTDNGFESIEITGPPGMPLDGWSFFVIDGDGTSSGNVTIVIPLDGQAIGSNGVLLIRDAATSLVPPPSQGTNVFVFNPEPDIQNGSQSYVLGHGTAPVTGSDLDSENDGIIDSPDPSFTAADAVSYTDGGASDVQYADDFGFPAANLGDVNPQAIYRVLSPGNRPFSWAGGSVSGSNPGPYHWSGTNNFGWAAVGVADPTQLTLDLGTPNSVFGGSGTGACCLSNGSCEILTAADCAASGGAYRGDDIGCENANCPAPFGACCFSDNCTITIASICNIQGGTYLGDNTDCSLTITQQPAGALSICWTADAVFSVSVSSGSPPSFQWQFRGPAVPAWTDLQEGPNFIGRQFLMNAHGVAVPTVAVDRAPNGWRASDVGEFRCVVYGACRAFATESAPLTVCRADTDCDGFVNSSDFFEFVGAFFLDNPAADFNDDGLVNSQDFFNFLAAFFDGC
jgi:hypothetical protein